jgi:hypothetical protein
MQKITLFLSTFLFVSESLFAQIDTKKTNFYSDFKIPETNSIQLGIKNPIAKFNFAKLDLEILNKSENFVLFKPEEFIFRFSDGDYHSEEKLNDGIVYPGSKKSPTLKVDNGNSFLEESFIFFPSGIYVFPAKGNIVEAENFHLPVSKNSFEAGKFKIVLLKLKKETDETALQFSCEYFGDKIGLISPSNAVIKTTDNTEWANAKVNDKTLVLFKGESKKITLIFTIPAGYFDMQTAEMDILWKNVFSESETTHIEIAPVKIVLDDVKSNEKNK